MSCEENEKQLKTSKDSESKMLIYESLLMECKDALQILRDEVKSDPVSKPSLMLSMKNSQHDKMFFFYCSYKPVNSDQFHKACKIDIVSTSVPLILCLAKKFAVLFCNSFMKFCPLMLSNMKKLVF